MLYKFDILFKKELSKNGIKVVTFSQLIDCPNAFGDGEGFANAEGELSMVLEGPEIDFSINALMRKYRAQLVGHMNAEMFGRDFPLRFVFSSPDDLSSIRIELRDEDGYTYSSKVYSEILKGIKTLYLNNNHSFVVLIAKEGKCQITDDMGITVNLSPGQVAFCSESTKYVTLKSDLTTILVGCSNNNQ